MARGFVVTGGRQRGSLLGRKEWHQYDEARLATFDLADGEVRCRVRYQTPGELCPDRTPSLSFRGGSVCGDRLAVVTQTEVVLFEATTLEVVATFSHPSFNDLHHVTAADDGWLVVNTGLDCLVRLDHGGTVLEHVSVVATDVWERFDVNTDYRKVYTTKPHLAHPNHVSSTPYGTWITRFEQSDAINLADPSKRIAIPYGPPHDGLLHDGLLWFTTVNGHIVGADPESCEVVTHIDMADVVSDDSALGWCRGLAFADDLVLVGFSRLRPSTARQNLSWIKPGSPLESRPTRVTAFALNGEVPVREWSLETAGLNTVFSILPL